MISFTSPVSVRTFGTLVKRVLLGSFCAAILLVGSASGAGRPNILWISCEDISPHLGCYGDEHAITPTLDALAKRGVRYTRAFTTTGVCATNRSSIITGMYPTTIGTQFMRCQGHLPSYVRCFTEYLRDAGYYCTNNSKEDYNFERPDSAWDESSPEATWRNRAGDQPFFAVFNFTLSHESKVWPRGEAHLKLSHDLTLEDMQDPQQLTLPPYYPDTPEVRRDWANYYENITQIDHQAASVLRQLEEDNLTDDTIVFFWSDHGAGLPRAKRWIYDSGTHVPLIVSIPDKYRTDSQGEPGTVDSQLMVFIDLAPTMLNLVGLDIPDHMQGRAFLGPNLSPERKFLVNVRDRMDGRYDMIRAVRDKRYRYIRNFMPWKPYAQYMSFAEVNQTMKALRRAAATGTLPAAAELFMAASKPAEELYDTESDPHEIVNLAKSADESHQKTLNGMRHRLREWEVDSADVGLIPEPLLRTKEEEFGNCIAIMQQNDMRLALQQVRDMIDLQATSQQRLDRAKKGLSARKPTTRYWALLTMTHLLGASSNSIGSDEFQPATLIRQFSPLLQDPNETVRLTAAYCSYLKGAHDSAIPLLVEGLDAPDRWDRLMAANYIDELAPQDSRIVAALEAVHEDVPDSYVVWVAEHALHRIDGRELPNRWGVY